MPIDEESLQEIERLVDAKVAPLRARREEQDAILSRLDCVKAALASLARAQLQTEKRLDALVEAQRKTDERLDALASRFDALAEAMRHSIGRLDVLTGAQRKTEEALARLVDKVGGLSEDLAELCYRARLSSYLGRRLRKLRVLEYRDIEEALLARLGEDEQDELNCTYIFALGRPPERPDQEVWLAVEVPSVVDQHDVERCVRRASLLRKLGHPALPVVAGFSVTAGADQRAVDECVAVMLGGRVLNWERAIEAALAG